MNWNKVKVWSGDIRFLITIFFILRLFAITNPPIEVGHNWRQTTVTMVARNFLETDNNILYPRIDIAGAKTGITGMEFPFLNYLIYLCSLVFGYSHWYGRLINLIVSSAGLYFFYLLVQKYFSRKMAFYATYLLMLSVWYTYSRKIMPDTFSMSLVFLGMYYGSNYLEGKEKINLLWYTVFTLLGILSKLPSGYLILLFALLMNRRHSMPKRAIIFCTVSIPILAVVSAYYFYWVPHLTNTYEFSHFFMGKSLSEGFADIAGHVNETLQKYYEEALGFIGFILFLAGLGLALYRREKRLLAVFAISFVGFMVVMFKAGFTFSHHQYYVIPFAPVMALVAGFALSQVKGNKWAVLLLFAFTAEAILSKNSDFYIKEDKAGVWVLDKTLDAYCGRNALIAINSGYVPTPMYFAHRKGWVALNEDLLDQENVKKLRSEGLQFIVVLKQGFGTDVLLPYAQVEDNSYLRIYKL